MFEAVTAGVRVVARPTPLPGESDAESDRFAFAYTIRVENRGRRIVQLISRRWSITDEHGLTRVVEGEGVVGVQPTLPPGAAFEYTSSAVIATPSGVMVGAYVMLDVESGRSFEVAIPAFPLEVAAPTGRAN